MVDKLFPLTNPFVPTVICLSHYHFLSISVSFYLSLIFFVFLSIFITSAFPFTIYYEPVSTSLSLNNFFVYLCSLLSFYLYFYSIRCFLLFYLSVIILISIIFVNLYFDIFSSPFSVSSSFLFSFQLVFRYCFCLMKLKHSDLQTKHSFSLNRQFKNDN